MIKQYCESCKKLVYKCEQKDDNDLGNFIKDYQFLDDNARVELILDGIEGFTWNLKDFVDFSKYGNKLFCSEKCLMKFMKKLDIWW